MYLRRIVGNGLAAVAEWRRMWNDEVLPYLRSQRPVAGPGVKIDQRPAGTMITAAGVGGSAPAAAGAVRLAVVTTSPTGGVGVGTVQLATVTASGGIVVSSGASISVTMPYLDGLN